MGLLGCFTFIAILALAVGAIMGMIAKARTTELRHRLDRLERKLEALRTAGQGKPAQPPESVPPREETPPLRTIEPAPAPTPVTRRDVETPPTAIPPSTVSISPGTPKTHSAAPGELTGVERMLGLRWLTWIGIGLLFLGIAFFLKYAYDRDWLGKLFGPRLRIATATLAALGLATSGWRSLRNGMQALGQGLLGGGQALLYLTIFAAFQPAALIVDEPLLGPSAAFALMALVTTLGLVVAVRVDAIAMAFLAVLGGLATPVLVGGGNDARDALCGYLLVLDLGVVLVASWRRWRALDLLALVGTAVLFSAWLAEWHHAHPQPDATLLWLLAFHLVFVLLPFVHHWQRRTPVPVDRFALVLANLGWTLATAIFLLHAAAPGLLAVAQFGGAALYVALGLATVRRLGDDHLTRDGCFALAVLLLTLGLFQALPANATSTAWFAEASALLWLGHRFAHVPTRLAALAMLAIAVLRTLAVHLPQRDPTAALLWNPWCVTLLVASLGLASFAAIHRRAATTDVDRAFASACGIGAALWALFVGGLEILRHAEGHVDDWHRVTPALAIAWLQLLGTLAFLLVAVRRARAAAFHAAFAPWVAAVIAVGASYERYAVDAWPALNGSCLTGLGAIGLLMLAASWSQRVTTAAPLAPGLFGTTQLAVTTLATVEAAVWLQRGDPASPQPTMAQVLGWVWLSLAIGGGLLARARTSQRMLLLAAIPLGCAAMAAVWLYGTPSPPHRLVGNQRFLFAAMVSATIAAWRPLMQRVGPRSAADVMAAFALGLQLFYSCSEAVAWTEQTRQGAARVAWLVWLFGAIAVAGAAGGGWRARMTGNPALRAVALAALCAAGILPLGVYLTRWDAEWMFVNLRAGLIGAAIATALRWAKHDERWRGVRWFAFGIALVALTAEPPVWLLDRIADPAEARRMALFAVTVVWIATALVLLVTGLHRDRRPVRIVALALFAMTAAKVLLLDMSGAQQLYRILAFVLVGLVFVGASWLYHRVARRLTGPS